MRKQKECESKYLNWFKSLEPNFPDGGICPCERPDYIVHTKTGRIGVELREVYHPKISKLSLQHREGNIAKLLKDAKEYADSLGIQPIDARFLCSPYMELPSKNSNQRSKLKQCIVTAVDNNLPHENERVREIDDPYSVGFPDGIDWVCLSLADNDQHEWRSNEAGEVINCRDVLQNEINEKSRKVVSYVEEKNLSQCWLLLVANGLKPSSFFKMDELSKTHIYKSPFDRTYFLNPIGNPELLRLNTVNKL